MNSGSAKSSELEIVPIFDGHNDVLLHLFGPRSTRTPKDFLLGCDGQIDIPKCKIGGLRGGFFAIYIPDQSGKSLKDQKVHLSNGWEYPLGQVLELEYAQSVADNAIAGMRQLCAQSERKLRLTERASDLNDYGSTDSIDAILHLEGAEPIAPDLSNLQEYYSRGLRSIGIVWSRPNSFGHGIPIAHPYQTDTGPGLSPAGLELIKACNQLGIVIDISHLNEAGFWDVIKLSSHPIAATHCNARSICNSNRNLSDRQLDAIKDSGGVVGVNFGVHDVRPDGQDDANTPISMLIDQFAYLADRIGVEHVAFGSDFDGTLVPQDIADASGLQKVIAQLRLRGFDDEAIRRVANGNWLRLARAILK